MPITFPETYRHYLSEDTVAKIDKLVEDGESLKDMLEFIDLHTEQAFAEWYETYLELCGNFDKEAVDIFITVVADVDDLNDFESRYEGWFLNPRDFAEYWFDKGNNYVDSSVVIDWEATADGLLNDEYEAHANYYFRSW